MSQNNLFPVFLKLEDMHTLIVGGGNVGWEKLGALLKNSPQARITMVADFFLEEVKEAARHQPNIELIHRKFRMEDLNEKDFVILATDDHDLHKDIKAETKKRHLLTNVADTPALCDAYLCSTVGKGDLKIGISTNGKSPTLAKRMREFLEVLLPDNIQELLDNLNSYRDTIKGDFEDKVNKLNDLTASMLDKTKN